MRKIVMETTIKMIIIMIAIIVLTMRRTVDK